MCKQICKVCNGICTCHYCKGAETVRIHSKANANYNVAVRGTVGHGTCIVMADDTDSSQLWLKDDKMAWTFDKKGGFSIVHKDTMKAIRVAPEEGKQVLLADYDPRKLDESLIWYQSSNRGRNYHTIYNGTSETVLHALRCTQCELMQPCTEGNAHMKENTLVVVMKDRTKKDDPATVAMNQLWKLTPSKCRF
ncbi:ricin B-like lectin EULS3 [Physcomitrium patens]|uniref:Ricin B lectin domain-containing protein n=1 Tax=Physcomitrium patens TaxID=3218 RepID=A0A2K1KVL2_PHYPA|nr:ricin B-like lectin EULS3 [Physcomitrium patens]XP_024371314.1 ricin B-like lectin EULS3 [Physcomitrium patens]PNR57786.1 hypothetical protein PHYPA_004780 [Physcomitrium patens]|eukprot:XP_024371313.1 ricin B-like lectin EULS3 [Physcomitrella patens]